MKLLASLVLIAGLPIISAAMWGYIPLEELIQDSDFIVVGTLTGASETTRDDIDFGEGVIAVDDVIWGDVRPGETLTLKWKNGHNVVCPRLGHLHSQNVQGIWLLTLENAREVAANYPGRFIQLADRRKVERILRRKNVCLRAAKRVLSPDEPADVSLVLRNATQTPLLFPGVQWHESVLYIGAGVDLALSIWQGGLHNGSWANFETKVNPLPGRVAVSDNLVPITVPPGQEYRMSLHVPDLFELAPDPTYTKTYALRLDIAGYDQSNEIRLYITEPEPTKKETRPRRILSGAYVRSGVFITGLCCFIGLVTLVKRNRTRARS